MEMQDKERCIDWLHRVRMGRIKSGNSWSFRINIAFSRPGKSQKLSVSQGMSWKLKFFVQNKFGSCFFVNEILLTYIYRYVRKILFTRTPFKTWYVYFFISNVFFLFSSCFLHTKHIFQNPHILHTFKAVKHATMHSLCLPRFDRLVIEWFQILFFTITINLVWAWHVTIWLRWINRSI